MGGPGSGYWYQWQGRKSTVEESLVVAMRNFRGHLANGSSGRSCQEAHQAERAFGRLGFDPEVVRLLSKRWGRNG